MEKRIITFKHNSRLKFSQFFVILLQPTAMHKCDALILRIITSLRMCRGIGMQAQRIVTATSLVIIT